MTRSTMVLALLVSVPGVAVPVQAQIAEALQGISAVDIIVHPLAEEAASCHVSTGEIEAAIRSSVTASRLHVDRNASPRIYASVNARQVSDVDDLCVASISVELHRTMLIPGTSRTLSGVAVWNITNLITDHTSRFGARVNDEIRHYVNRFIADWMNLNGYAIRPIWLSKRRAFIVSPSDLWREPVSCCLY